MFSRSECAPIAFENGVEESVQRLDLSPANKSESMRCDERRVHKRYELIEHSLTLCVCTMWMQVEKSKYGINLVYGLHFALYY